MYITPTDLLFPSGPITPQMFRGAMSIADVNTALAGFTMQASTRTRAVWPDTYDTASGPFLVTVRAAERALSLNLAYMAVWGMHAAMPDSASEGGATATWGTNLKSLRDIAGIYLMDFTALTTGQVVPSTVTRQRAQSWSTTTTPEF